jgi:hypothetical protein
LGKKDEGLNDGRVKGNREMSLSGLDDVKVKEAHEAAVAEPGGW